MEVKKSLVKEKFYLGIIELLKKGLIPTQIAKELNVSKQRIHYYTHKLKELGIIEKKGYGVWEVKKSLADSLKSNPSKLAPDMIRGHGFQFTFRIPKNLRNWEKRRKILEQMDIEFKELNNMFGGAEKIKFKDRTVILTPKSIIFYEKHSYFANTSSQAKDFAVYSMLSFIKQLESKLKANFSFNGKYKFKISRQHYALIKNALAKQYDKEGKKLHIKYLDEEWCLIDNSFNLHELETVHPKTAEQDNKKVQNFFNGLKELEDYTPKVVMNSIGQLTNNMNQFGIHLQSHIKAVQDISKGVNQLVDITKSVQEENKKLKQRRLHEFM